MDPVSFNSQSTAVDFDPFADGEVLRTALATESQKEIWASVQLGDDANCAYNESASLMLRGELDISAIRSAFQQLVQRHESLRTTFSPDGIHLCITEILEIPVPLVDLSELSEVEQLQQIAEAKQQAVTTPFDLEHGPLIRVSLLKLQPQLHLLILTTHHIIFDGWSWGVVLPELGQLYSAFHHREAADLAEPDHFGDYALMLEAAEGSEDALETEAYWLQQFSGSVPIVDFPTDRSRPSVRTFDAAREDWELSANLITGLKQLGTKFGCSLMTTLLAGFEVLLYRLTGQDELVVGIPAAGQAATGLFNLVGHCVNLLPLRTHIDGHQSFTDYLQIRKPSILDAYDHQQFTFGNLIKRLTLVRDSSRIPLVPIAFNLEQGIDSHHLPFSELSVEFSTNPRLFENFELFLNAVELQGKVILECQYNTNLFDRETICYRMAELETVLLDIVAHPDKMLSNLRLTPDREQQLLAQWNQTQTDYPRNSCIHHLFEAQVEQTPEAIAVRLENHHLTYRELNERANQLAHHLQSLGVGANTLVGICTERSLESIIGLVAILKAGGAYVPLDPSYPQERLAFIIEDTQLSILLTQSSLNSVLPPYQGSVICLDDCSAVAAASKHNPVSPVVAEDLAYVMFTSGSTGVPKGVAVPHRGVVRLVTSTTYASFNSREVFLQLAPLAFDASTFEIWGSLLNGGQLVLFPALKPDLEELERAIRDYNVTTLWLTAGLFHLIVDERIDALKPLKQLLAGGDILSLSHVERFLQAVPNCTLVNGYGPTESTTFTCCHLITQTDLKNSSIPIGSPIANTQVYVLDSHLQRVPIGVPGELYIGGDGLAIGYFNRPDLTLEAFIPDPFNPDSHTSLYKTGDIVRFLTNGKLEFLGRSDYQVKIRGFRIELGEIEVVLRQHPKLNDAAVVAQADVLGGKQLIAYAIAQPGLEVSTDELRNFLKQRLPDYMVPSFFVLLPKFPLTPNGKIDRQALPKPDSLNPSRANNYVAPRNETEQKIVAIWQQILNLEKVSIYDNFFDLGGHSLLAIQMISRLRQNFGIELPLRTLFEVPRLADLVEQIETIRWLAATEPETDKGLAGYEEGEL